MAMEMPSSQKKCRYSKKIVPYFDKNGTFATKVADNMSQID
jgi:hypothetical protein